MHNKYRPAMATLVLLVLAALLSFSAGKEQRVAAHREWVSGDELTDWHSYMHERFGWPHLLGARAGKNRLDQLSETLDYSSYEQHKPDYEKYVETIEARPCKPPFSEDRFRIREPPQSKDYTMEMTRRGLWHSAMAGGVANIWGNLVAAAGANDGSASSAPAPVLSPQPTRNAEPAGSPYQGNAPLPAVTESYLYQSQLARLHRAADVLFGYDPGYWLAALLMIVFLGAAWRWVRL
jgi:hypothetical protein